MAIELANAYINIVPSTKDIAPAVKNAFGDVEKFASSTGTSVGSKLSGAIGKTLKIGMGSVGVAAGGVFAGSLAKGMGRLTSIDSAEKKLEGLGNSAQQVEGIMKNALASVDGTAYGMGEAAVVASQVVASGIKPGEELERVLKTVADTAAISGDSMAGMGAIFGSVAARGKLMGDDLMQLRSRGLPVMDILAESLDKTTEEVEKMASNGEVSFEIFEKAMREKMGGAAQSMGDTFQGSVQNVGAAMGRLGEAIQKPFFENSPKVISATRSMFNEMTDAVKPVSAEMTEKLKPVAEDIASVMENRIAPALGSAAGAVGDFIVKFSTKAIDSDIWERLGNSFEKLGDLAGKIWPDVSRLLDSFATIGANVSVSVWEALVNVLNAAAPLITNVMVPLVETVAKIAETNPGAVQAVVMAFMGFKMVGAVAGPMKKFSDTAQNVGGAVKFLGGAFSGSGGIANGLVNVMAGFNNANPLIAKMGGSVGKATGALAKMSPVLKVVGTAIGTVGKAVGGLIMAHPIIAGITAVGAALALFFTKTETGQKMWASLMGGLKAGWDWLAGTFASGWDWLTEKISGFWEGIQSGWNTVSDVFSTLKAAWSEITGIFTGTDNGMGALFELFGEDKALAIVGTLENIKAKLDHFVEGVKVNFQRIAQFAGNVVQTVGALFSGGFELVKDIFATGWLAIQAIFTGDWGRLFEVLANAGLTVREHFGQMVDNIKEIWAEWVAALMEKFATFGDWLGGKVQGMWETVKGHFTNAVNSVVETVTGWYDRTIEVASQMVDSMINYFKDLPGRISETFHMMKDYALEKMGEWIISVYQKSQEIINTVAEWISELPERVQTWFQDMKDRAIQKMAEWIVDVQIKAQEVVDSVVTWVSEMPDRVKALFVDAGTWLVQAGKDIFNGLWNGMKDIWNGIKSWISDKTNEVKNFFTGVNTSAETRIGMSHADGAIVAFANGGARLPKQATIQRPAGTRGLVQWAEAETGGEAFIPLAASKRARSTKILATVADSFGLSLVGRDGQAYEPGVMRELGPTRVGTFADGGIMSASQVLAFVSGRSVNGKKAPRSLEGAPYTWGGGLLSSWGDCSGAMSGIAAFIVGMALAGRKFATGNEGAVLSQMGFKRGTSNGKNAFEVGFFNGGAYGGHTSGTLYDGSGKATNLEMGGGRGNGQIGGAAAGARHSQYTDRYWIGLKGGAGFDSIDSTSVDGLNVSGGGKSKRTIDWGTASSLASEWEERYHREKGLQKYLQSRARVYDKGGIVPKGGIMVNLDEPEVVYPKRESATLLHGMKYMPGMAKSVSTIAQHSPQTANALERVASTDFDALGQEITAAIRGGDDGYAELANLIGDQLALKVTNKLAFIGDQVRDMADGSNMRAFLSDMSASQALELSDAVGGLFGGGELSSIFGSAVQGFEDLEDAAVMQVDAANAVTQAEKNLAEARAEYAELLGETPEASKKTLRRIEDAEAAVAKAREGGKPEQIAKAEKRLARVREDAADEMEKDGVKSADKLIAARESVSDAEHDYTKALGVVEMAAKHTGQAQIMMAVKVAETVIEAVRWVFGKVDDVFAGIVAAWNSIADMFGAVADYQAMVRGFREDVARLTIDQALAQIELSAAYRKVRMAAFDVATAHLKSLVDIANAQEEFDDSLQDDIAAASMAYEGLGTKADEFRHGIFKTFDEVTAANVKWSDKTWSLWWNLQAARTGGLIAEKQAQKGLLEAQYDSLLAAIDMKSVTDSLGKAAKKLAIASGETFGMSEVEATTAERWAKLQAEKAELTATQARGKTWLNPVNWFTTMPENQRRLRQIEEELKKLEAREDFNIDEETKKNTQQLVNKAGAMGFFGAADQVEQMVKNSALGDASRMLEKMKWESDLIDKKGKDDEFRNEIARKKAEVSRKQEVEPLDLALKALTAEQDAQKTYSQMYQTKNEQVRDALMALARQQENTSQNIADMSRAVEQENKQPSVMNLYGNQFDADAIERALSELGIRVNRMENPRATGAQVAASRR